MAESDFGSRMANGMEIHPSNIKGIADCPSPFSIEIREMGCECC
ncbi:hypothetical protein CCACVL1_13411 [Corchorus capsularis]|uniref:Uncharacterized protein n=1 Tax=Corchorus capsularis TaxID=210143 RepID=A0A1R3IB76_COCAP|nr:hypothetical protein CCACVL1_13411 [Corchorus capsularis]